MGRRPLHSDIRLYVLATAAALLLAVSGASAKKPPWAHGPGNPHGNGGAPALAAPQAAPAPAQQGHGKGRGRGHGKGHAPLLRPSGGTSALPASVSLTPTASVQRSAHAKHRRSRPSRGHRGARPAVRTHTPVRARPVAVQVQPQQRRPAHKAAPHNAAPPVRRSTVIRTFEHVVRVVPAALKAVIAVLAFLVLVAAVAYFLLARTTRYLERQRQALLGEIGVLQAALLPEVADEIGGLRPSVAYRPADGPAAGGDFYDAFPLEGGRVGMVIGDVSGHGRDALMRTSLLRHTLRAYLDAGLEPRAALQVGGRVLDRGLDELATVILATYDPESHLLRYASAGHPPPVFLGAPDHVPVTQGSSPPIGAGIRTGLRQTTVSVPPGSVICLFTDGLIEARRDGEMIGRLGLARIIAELGAETTAAALLDRVAAEVDQVSDDMAACLFRAEGDADVPAFRCEELEVRREDATGTIAGRFSAACGLDHGETARLTALVRETVDGFGGALLRVSIAADAVSAEVLPANVESLASGASRRAA